MKIQSSKHKYVGSTKDIFFDVIITSKQVSLYPWRLYITDAPDDTDIQAADWENRETIYPGIESKVRGNIIGAVNQTLVYKLGSPAVIKLDDQVRPLGSGEWSDHSNWFFLQDLAGNLLEPLSVFADTFVSRCKSMRYLLKSQSGCAMQLIVPFKTKHISDCSISLLYNADHGMSSNMAFADADFIEVTQKGYNGQFFPSLSLVGPDAISADSTITFTVELINKQGIILDEEIADIYLETTAGYLPKTRITTVDGVATFKLSALGLDVGDQIKIKCGFKNYSGIAEITTQVV